MTVSREQIHQALADLLAQAVPFPTISRRLRHWSECAASEQPALFLVTRGEEHRRLTGMPSNRTIMIDLIVYAQAPDDYTAGSQAINPLLDAIEAALAPPPGWPDQTLGGLVVRAWIEGKVTTDEGVLGHQGVAIIPIHIVAPE